MHALIERRELHADRAKVVVAAFEFFHAIRPRRVNRCEEQQPLGRTGDVRRDGVIRNVPVRRLGLQPEDHRDVRLARRFEMLLADIAPRRRVHPAARHVRAQPRAEVEFRAEEVRVNVNDHRRGDGLTFNASSGSETSGVKPDPSA